MVKGGRLYILQLCINLETVYNENQNTELHNTRRLYAV